ncbi:hypothetical protein [Nocardioides sp.]|uniref:hypothetical protein n=1 Tax=Nocardioides sp. TaxID=35761 RepID=UPI0035172C8C
MNEINSNQTPRFEQFPQRPARRSAGARARLVLATAAVVGLTGGVGAALAAHATGDAPAAQSHTAQTPSAAGTALRSTDAGRAGDATDVMARRSSAGSTASTSTSTGNIQAPNTQAPAAQAPRSATPLLWASDTAIHDGARVVRLQGVTEVAAVHRSGSGWVVEDVPADGPYVRLLKVTAAGRTTQAALGTRGGAFDASGSRYVSRARDDAHYEVVDLATGRERLVPAPAGDLAAEGTAVFAGSRGTELITAWLPLPSTRPAATVYYRSNLDGSHAAPLARGVAGARFSAGRSFFVGSTSADTSAEGGIAGGRTSTDGTAASPGWTAPGSLAASAPYSPDGTRVVAFADAGGSEQPSSTEQRTAVVRASATGRVIARVALPRGARDLTLADDGHVVVLRHTGSAAEPRVSVASCTLTGACHAIGSGRGIGVLGGPR